MILFGRYFCEPTVARAVYDGFVNESEQWLLCPQSGMGLRKESLRRISSDRVAGGDGLAHYAQATTDIEFQFPFGWGELWGICWRGDYDLRCHSVCSGKDFHVKKEADGQTGLLPHVVEPSLGLDRLLLAVLTDALDEDVLCGEMRRVLRLPSSIAPISLAVLPLSKKDELVVASKRIHGELRKADLSVELDVTQSIGRR